MKAYNRVVQTLIESIPYIRAFQGHKIVIKYGGAAQTSQSLKESFAQDLVLMYMVGIRPIVIHGGGKRIDEVIAQLGIEREFVDGYRVTSFECMKVVEMVLSGEINKELSAFLNLHGAQAIGISGKDGMLLSAKAKDGGRLGYTGDITSVNSEILTKLIAQGFIPIVAPVALSGDCEDLAQHPGYNINADLAACEIAKAVGADKVIFLSDISGVLDSEKELISSLNPSAIENLKAQGVISGGMIPKLEACVQCVQNGVKKVHIIDGRIPHSLLLELFTKNGIGTQITL